MTTQKELRKAVKRYGGPSKVARALGMTPQRVGNWLKRGVPVQNCPQVERLLGVPCSVLRPDVEWAGLRTAA